MADTQPLAPTDAELIAELEAAGVEFMAFRGGLCGTKEVWVTAGSQDAKKIAQGVRAALAKWGVQPVPAGYALVPVEPTPEMLSVMWVNKNSSLSEAYNSLSEAYSAMLAASPQPVAREPLTDEHLRVIERMHVYAHTATLMDFARAIERAHGITTNGRKDAP